MIQDGSKKKRVTPGLSQDIVSWWHLSAHLPLAVGVRTPSQQPHQYQLVPQGQAWMGQLDFCSRS